MLDVAIQIITILTFVVLCISVFPAWIRRLEKEVKISVVETSSEYKIMISYFDTFIIKKICMPNDPSFSHEYFHPHNTLFQLKTWEEITKKHFMIVKKSELKDRLNRKITVVSPSGILDFKVEISAGNGKENAGYFKIKTP